METSIFATARRGAEAGAKRRRGDGSEAGHVPSGQRSPQRPPRRFLTEFALQAATAPINVKFSHEDALAQVETAWPSFGLASGSFMICFHL